MTFRDHHSPDAARENHQDLRQNGILSYDHRNTLTEGQAAFMFGSSSTGVEIDIGGANLLINGSKTSAPPSTVTLTDGHDTLWRTDHIYATVDGGYSVHQGEPGDNQYVTHEIENGEVVHTIQQNEQAGGPRPKGTPFIGVDGELLFSVLVPPGATTSNDLSSQHIWDRRRLAPDVLDLEYPRQPPTSERYFDLPAGESAMWPINIWAGYTFRFWDFVVTYRPFGALRTSNLTFYIVSREDMPQDLEEWRDRSFDWDEYAIYQKSGQLWQGPEDPAKPIIDFDAGNESLKKLEFVLENTSEFAYAGAGQVSLQTTYTLEPTSDL